jgi:hypothetical protein
LFHSAIDLITQNLNNIKIIDQIDEKEENYEGEKEDKLNVKKGKGMMDGGESASVLSNIKLDR